MYIILKLVISAKYRSIKKIGEYSIKLEWPLIALFIEFSSSVSNLKNLNIGFPRNAITLMDKIINHVEIKEAYSDEIILLYLQD